jgi:hypothetical protein
VRIPVATLALLRRAAARPGFSHVDPWLRHTPNGIRV